MEGLTASPSADNADDGEKKVYVTFSLAKYPFLKNKKVGDTGTAKFKAEIEKSENTEKGDATHHTVAFQDLSNAKAGERK